MNRMKWLFVLLVALVVASGAHAEIDCMPRPDRKPLVQVAILLDTSNSMDGLIEQAKSQLWRVTNDLAYSSRCGERPTLEVALFEYGNDTLSPGENYVRQVLPFTTDLDLVAEKLFALRTNGGNEYCGAVIQEAVKNLRWIRRSDVYKTVFIAGNEPFTQGPVYFREAVAQAVSKDIRVNTIFCGSRSEGIQTAWQDGALAGRGTYLSIDQNRVVRVDPTPYDDEISRLGGQLDTTYVLYGDRSRTAFEKRKGVDALAQAMPTSSAAVPERAIAKAGLGYAAPEWDVVSQVATGKMASSHLKSAELPVELQGKSDRELEGIFKDQYKKRSDMQSHLADLKKQRDLFLAKRQAENGASGALSLDEAMRDAIRSQAGALNFRFGNK